ncbi:insulinase family protein [Candidatus Kapabacteria bacterium]|nr:insulinase family protein [Candidatus Kapabacteria bacterium]
MADLPDPNAKIKNDPSILVGKLDNGLTYYIKENKRPENRAEIQMVIKAGSLHEDEKQLGLAHFIEHMAFNGTKNFPKNKLVEYLESTGMSFGGDINANTSWERVYYLLQIPTDDSKMLDDGFQVLRDWLRDVSFDKGQIDDERKIIVEEWRLRTRQAQAQSTNILFNQMFKGSRYEKMTIGDTNIILNAPKVDFTRYYDKFYQPDIAAIIAVGDFDKKEILKLIKSKFANVKKPSTPTIAKSYKVPEHKDTRVSVYENPELPSYTMYMAQRHYNLPKGTFGVYRKQLVDRLASQMLALRFQELTQKGGAAFQFASASKQDFPSELMPFFGVAALKADDLEGGIKEMLQEIYRMDQHGFLATELDRVKGSILSSMESMVKNKDNIQSNILAAEFSRNFLENESMPGIDKDYEYTKLFLDDITLDEVNKAAKSFASENSVVLHLTGPKDLLTKEQILKTYNEVKSSKLEPWVDAASAAKLMETIPTAGDIVDMNMESFEYIKNDKGDKESFDVVTYDLSNGIKVKLMKTDLNDDQVVMRAFSPGGNLLTDENNYFSAVQADTYVGLSGIGENDITTIQKILSDKNVRVSPYISDYNEGISGSGSPDDLESMFQLIHLYFTSPRMDKQAIQADIDRLKENVKNSRNDPNTIFSDAITKTLYNDHPRQFAWDMDNIGKIDPAKAIEWYKERFADASDFTFYFVGKFEDGPINEMITTYLASLPTLDRKESWKDRNIRTVKGPLKKVIKAGKEPNATVRLRIDGDYPEYSQESNMKMYGLSRALSILLTENLREKKQIVYSAGAFDNTSMRPTKTFAIQVAYGCDPERVEEGIEVVKEQMNYLKNNKLNDTYMSRVKEVIESQYKKAFESNNFWAGYLQSVDWNGMKIDRAQNMLDLIDGISADDIQMYAKKYFRIDELKQFIRYPEAN